MADGDGFVTADPGRGGERDAVTPFYGIDDGLALNRLACRAPDAAMRRKIPVENPARLYDL
ncbi:MAG TPA: hypothetical protein VHG31_00250 [Stellaceae bacterium]|nr:hypothetical protein [Stellaceae bacterium]